MTALWPTETDRPPPRKVSLRPYQVAALDGIARARREHRSGLVVMPTGTGKTVVMTAAIGADLRHSRAMMMVHRREIVMQIAATVERMHRIVPDIEMADSVVGHKLRHRRAPVCVASKDSLTARLRAHHPDDYSIIVTDEAHHATADSYRRIYDHMHGNPRLFHLGVTATPDRSDLKSLYKIFEPAFEYDLVQAIKDGWLVKPRQFVLPTEVDFSGIATRAGDLSPGELARVLEEEGPLHEMVLPTVQRSGDRRCLIFAASVRHAEMIAEIIRRTGRTAEHVWGEMDDAVRSETFRAFGAGDIQFLVNVGIATEGWDDPATDGRGVQVIAIMRPTKSRSLYAQMVGRGTRPIPGLVDDPALQTADDRKQAIAGSAKPWLEVIDYGGVSGRHSLCRLPDIVAGQYSDEVVAEAKRRVNDTRHEATLDMDIILEMAERDVRRRMQEERRKHIVGTAKFDAVETDPFAAIGVPRRYVPWYMAKKPASDKQIALLERRGVPMLRKPNMGEAMQLIDAIMSRPSPKQEAALIKKGYDAEWVSTLNTRQASALMDATAKNGWRRVANPHDIVRAVPPDDRRRR